MQIGFLYFPNFENKTYPVQVIPENTQAEALFMHLAGSEQPTAADIGIFYTLVVLLVPHMSYNISCRSKEIVMLTEKYLLNHPFADASELAQNCAVSEAALYAAFKKSSDITPNRLKNRILLKKAKDIIISTDQSIEHISDTLEFSSVSYFRKKFKQYFGITPKQMRLKNKI